MPVPYIRKCPDRAIHGSVKEAVLSLKPGESIYADTALKAQSYLANAYSHGLRMTREALHPYHRAGMKKPAPKRRFKLTLLP